LKIFLSRSTKDKQFVQSLAAELKAEEIQPWLASFPDPLALLTGFWIGKRAILRRFMRSPSLCATRLVRFLQSCAQSHACNFYRLS
jgi:hypothetical protein